MTFVELFFKALKQNLKIKTFLGTSPNAVKTQIWTALIAMLIIRYLQLMVDLTIQILYQTDTLTFKEGLQHIENARKFAVELFPGKAKTFDLIYKPRLMRVLQERGILEFSQN